MSDTTSVAAPPKLAPAPSSTSGEAVSPRVLTSVLLDDGAPMRRRLVLGRPEASPTTGNHARFAPGRVVGYLVDRPPAQALFIFRAADGAATTKISGVSPSVHLLVLAATTRAVKKATAALRYLARSNIDPDCLSDGFWLRLAEFVTRTGSRRILHHVDALLRGERRGA